MPEKVKLFFGQFKPRHLTRGEIVCGPDTEPGGLYYLEWGVVRQYALSAVGDELTVNVFKPGAFFPVGWLINNEQLRHYYEATEEVIIRVAPKKTALEFIHDSEVEGDLLKRIYQGLDGFFLRMEQLMTGDSRAKIVAQLIIGYKRFGQGGQKMTKVDLAAQAGVTRETVSRQLAKLKETGLIEMQAGEVRIVDVAKLEALLA